MSDTVISPDGKWMWNGSEWLPAPPGTEPTSSSEKPTFSPDGEYLWAAGDWIPAPPKEGEKPASLKPDDGTQSPEMNEASESKQDDIIVILAEGIRQLGLADENTLRPLQLADGSEMELKIGARVLVNWRGRGHFYYADIHYIHDDEELYDVTYDKGDTEQKIRPEHIRHAFELNIGDRVAADWRSQGHYFLGRIAAAHPDHSFMVQFDDGDEEDDIRLSRILIVDDEESESVSYMEAILEFRQLIEMFHEVDFDQTGVITSHHLLELMNRRKGEILDKDVFMKFFDDFNIGMDLEIDYRRFAKLLLLKPPEKPQFEG